MISKQAACYTASKLFLDTVIYTSINEWVIRVITNNYAKILFRAKLYNSKEKIGYIIITGNVVSLKEASVWRVLKGLSPQYRDYSSNQNVGSFIVCIISALIKFQQTTSSFPLLLLVLILMRPFTTCDSIARCLLLIVQLSHRSSSVIDRAL